MVVVHCTATPSFASVKSWFQNPASQVSAHFVIDKDGTIYEFVDPAVVAWHAHGYNAHSVGIEHVAAPNERLTDAQEAASAALVGGLLATYKVPADRVFGHGWIPGTEHHTTCPDKLWDSQAALTEWVRIRCLSDGAGTAAPGS